MKKENSSNVAGAGLFIAVGLIVMGFLLKSAVTEFRDSERVVFVKGLSEKKVMADHVTWPICYKIGGNDLAQLYTDYDAKNKIVIDFLKKNGLSESDILSSAPSLVDIKAERYSNKDAIYRYLLTSVITVSSDRIELVRQLIMKQSELLKKGVALASDDYRYRVKYAYNGLNKIKPTMIEEATKNARKAADKFAQDSDSELGKIKSASQGQFSIYNNDETTPYLKKVRVVTTITYYLED